MALPTAIASLVSGSIVGVFGESVTFVKTGGNVSVTCIVGVSDEERLDGADGIDAGSNMTVKAPKSALDTKLGAAPKVHQTQFIYDSKTYLASLIRENGSWYEISGPCIEPLEIDADEEANNR